MAKQTLVAELTKLITEAAGTSDLRNGSMAKTLAKQIDVRCVRRTQLKDAVDAVARLQRTLQAEQLKGVKP